MVNMERKKKFYSGLWDITKKTISTWWDADPFGQSSLVAYNAIFSIPALLVIVISLAGLIFGKDAVQGQISQQISSVLGADAAKQLQEIIAKSSDFKTSVIASIIGVITLILGSIGVFTQLQTSL